MPLNFHVFWMLLLAPAWTSCDASDMQSAGGPAIAVDIAALNLSGVGDVVWDIEVDNGRTPTADVVGSGGCRRRATVTAPALRATWGRATRTRPSPTTR